MTTDTMVPAAATPWRELRTALGRIDALHRYVAGVIAAGVALSVGAGALTYVRPPSPAMLGVAALLCLLADRPLLDLRFGRNQESFTWAELCVVLGLFVVPSASLVVIAGISVLLFHLLMRRAVLKSAFNASCFAIGAALAASTSALVGGGSTMTVRHGIGLALGALLFHVWNGAAVARVVALSAGLRFRDVYRRGALLRTLVCTGNVTVGIGVLLLYSWSRPTVVVLPPLLVLLYAAYRGYLHAMQERDVWQLLERAGRELNQLDEREVATAAVMRAAQMLGADVVDVIVEPAGATARVYSGDARGLFGPDTPAPESGGQIVLYQAALDGPVDRIGVLRVGYLGSVHLSRREQQVLKTFAHAVSSTLQNAHLYSEMIQHADAKAYEAAHDALTGLGNRTLLQESAEEALRVAVLDGTHCGLLIVDLDHFKEINDTLGHVAGDLFLKQVGQRIQSAVGTAGIVCRLGGDEYAVLLTDLESSAQADEMASRLLEVLAQPVKFDGLRLSIEGSVGVADFPSDAESFDELLQRADVALYQAKESRGSFAHYSAERDVSSVHRLALAAELRTALQHDELVVHFQPQYDVTTQAVVGAEALVRWQHPDRGLLQPDAFISAVEHSGLIRDFTLAVLDKAVRECAAWSRSGRPLTVAVNLSARNLLDRDLPIDVARVLTTHALPPELLVLEITETTMMSELDVVETVLGELRRIGVQVSVDDFGTGYSSLAFLQRVQVNEVKIDRGFVNGLSTSDNDRALVRATVQLAHSLGARAVAEGVETDDQLLRVAELGCDLAQGYHLSRPVPGEVLRELVLAAHVAVPTARSAAARLAAVPVAGDDECIVSVVR